MSAGWADLAASLVQGAVNAGPPVALAAIGEVVAERSGVLNLGVEGMMVVGALAAFVAAAATGNPWIGVLAAMAAAAGLGLLHAVLTVSMRANQVAAGLALTILGGGIASYLGQPYAGRPSPRFGVVRIPWLADLPVLGEGVFAQPLLVYLTAALAGAVWLFLHRTRPGLRLQVVGEAPDTAASLGVRVGLHRYGAVVFGGVLAGAAGAYLPLFDTPSWDERIVAGKGWIAVAMVVFGSWGPVRTALGAYLFGGMTAAQLRLQAFGIRASEAFLHMTPYLFTIVLLVLYSLGRFRRRFGAPAALGLPYQRGGR